MDYIFLPLVMFISFCYFCSWRLVSFKKISLLTHRKVWNITLLSSLLILISLSLLLIIRSTYDIYLPLPFNLLFWHVEFGIIFATIALFHAGWHLSYFKVALKLK